MKTNIILLLLAASLSSQSLANERYYVGFEVLRNGKVLVRGNDYVTEEMGVWSNGHVHSYLKLRCDKDKAGRPVKLFSTVGLFDGVRLTHRLVGDQIEINVLRSKVKNRRVEIHSLGKKECSNLSPIVTTVTQFYTYPARIGATENRAFGDAMSFGLTIESGGNKREWIAPAQRAFSRGREPRSGSGSTRFQFSRYYSG